MSVAGRSIRRELLVKGVVAVSIPVLLLGIISIVVSGIILFSVVSSRNESIANQSSQQVEEYIKDIEQDILLLTKEIRSNDKKQSHLDRFMSVHP